MRRTRILAPLLAGLLAGAFAAACGGGEARLAPWGESPFRWRGVVEGFYGAPYVFEARLDMIRWIAGRGMNFYVYAPKLDPFHRSRWREPYPPDETERFRILAGESRAAGVTFNYAVSPGLSMVYSSEEDFDALVSKLESLLALGIRSFTLSFDDVFPALTDPADIERFGGRLVEAHIAVANRLFDTLRAADPEATLFFTPTFYQGEVTQYVVDLGAGLDPGIPVFWTGPDVFSREITVEYMGEISAALRRKAVLWDNFPANDGLDFLRLFLGPYQGRDPRLPEVVQGIASNPMMYPYASWVPLGTVAEYLAAPAIYDPGAAWDRSILRVAGGRRGFASLKRFANQNHSSRLDPVESPDLAAEIERFWAAYPGEGTELDAASTELRGIFEEFAGMQAALDAGGVNEWFVQEAVPWLVELARIGQTGIEAVDLLLAHSPPSADPAVAARLAASKLAIIANPIQICGTVFTDFLERAAGLYR